MKLKDYKLGDLVEVLVNNPRNNNKEEWRSGEVISVRTINTSFSDKFKPYPIVIVRVLRTYCKAEPVYRFVDNIPVFDHYSYTYTDKMNEEGFIYENQIRLKK